LHLRYTIHGEHIQNPNTLAIHSLALKGWKKLAKNLQEQFKKVLKQRVETPHLSGQISYNPFCGIYTSKTPGF
jgi:mRNA-degrading endonuclease RelE of RelBE toxin-antitoxin system